MKAFHLIAVFGTVQLFAVGLASAQPTTHYVNGNASSSGDGLSWATAKQHLEDALDNANQHPGDSVWVAGATTGGITYRVPSASSPFAISNHITVLGGFPPTGDPGLPDRNPALYVTILSGDVDGDDEPDFVSRGDNSSFVVGVAAGSSSDNTKLDGFTVRGAQVHGIDNGDGSAAFFANLVVADNGLAEPSDNGAGFHNGGGGANPRIDACRFEHNQGKLGGALDNPYGSSFLITNCAFSYNATVGSNAHSAGGAIYTLGGAAAPAMPTLRSCTFDFNSTEDDGGGAIFLNGDLLILSSFFRHNISTGTGGAISFQASHLTMQDVRFEANGSGREGGAIFGTRGCNIDSMNCLFFDNVAGGDPANPIPSAEGGAIYATLMNHVTILNATVTRNYGLHTGGLYIVADTVCDDDPFRLLQVENCILWDNHAADDFTTSAVTRQIDGGVSAGGTLTIDYNDIDDGAPGDNMVPFGSNDIDLDPRFRSPAMKNWRLKVCSPCIDAADSLVAHQDIYNLNSDGNTACSGGCDPDGTGERVPDLDLRQRVVDGPTHNSGVAEDVCHVGCPYIIDMGAYEFECPLLGDLNGDGLVNGLDIQPFTRCVTHAADAVNCACGDFNLDGVVDVLDVPCFIQALLMFTPTCEALLVCDTPYFHGTIDCNENGILDALDIAHGTSADCNNNGIPDECDVAEGGGPNDVNGNGIPDECETDCNANGIPDSYEIAQSMVADCDEDGVPDDCEPDCNGNSVADACDIASEESQDCNANGIPDECEEDCNSNGVPDDCDIASSTSQDCNGNGIPDECDLTRSLLGSWDCNDNGIPDECDIASGYSLDSNHNHIPDECEGGSRSMADGGEGGGSEFDEAAAWNAFWAWYADEIFGEWDSLTGSEKFNAVMDELAALGLPPELPW